MYPIFLKKDDFENFDNNIWNPKYECKNMLPKKHRVTIEEIDYHVSVLLKNYKYMSELELMGFVNSYFLRSFRLVGEKNNLSEKAYHSAKRYLKKQRESYVYIFEKGMVYTRRAYAEKDAQPERDNLFELAMWFHIYMAPLVEENFAIPVKTSIHEKLCIMLNGRAFSISAVPWPQKTADLPQCVEQIVKQFEYHKAFEYEQNVEIKNDYENCTKGLLEIFVLRSESMITLIRKIGEKKGVDYLENRRFAILINSPEKSKCLSPVFKLWRRGHVKCRDRVY